MNFLINLVWLFIIQQTIAGFFVYQHGFENSAFTLLFSEKFSVPLLVISFGIPLYIVLVWMCSAYSAKQAGDTHEFPTLGITNIEPRFKKYFQRLSFLAFIVLPWIGFIWMWVEFHDVKQQAWLKADPSLVVGEYEIKNSVLSFIGNWDQYRYGRNGEGHSFVPFWQPVILMWPLTFIALAMALKYSKNYLRLIWK